MAGRSRGDVATAVSASEIDRAVEAGRIAVTEDFHALCAAGRIDVVIDATGKASAMTAGFDYVAHGGTYVLVSVVLDTISFADPKFHAREISLLGSRNATREDFSKVFDAIREGRVPTEALATHRASLDDSPACFPEWIEPKTGVIKALIKI